jgi:phospholipase/carboxylesterase
VIDPVLTVDDPFTLRYLMPESQKDLHRILLLLHGWTGDENTMWIFIRQMIPGTLILAPRGLFPANPSGYGWFQSHAGLDTPVREYLPVIDDLLTLMDKWAKNMGDPLLPVEVMGFSQGAAVAGVLLSQYPARVRKAAMLAGFLPPDLSDILLPGSLKGHRTYIAHGTKDEIVPFSRAEEAVAALSSAGAITSFCPSDAAHKLSLDCAKGLIEFLENEEN